LLDYISKTNKFNVDINREDPEPDPTLYDSHMSKTVSHKNQLLNDLYKSSLIYLFDYDIKNKIFNKCPRQIIPIAVFLIKNTSPQPPSSQLLRKLLFLSSPFASQAQSPATSTIASSLTEKFEDYKKSKQQSKILFSNIDTQTPVMNLGKRLYKLKKIFQKMNYLMLILNMK
jgi:hypothetical protein